eukprot:SM000146S00989  [mRNA]  locus=s146:302266:304349:- [translate_table: standard]
MRRPAVAAAAAPPHGAGPGACTPDRSRRRRCGVHRRDPLYGEGSGALAACPVPAEQQPYNEYRALLDTFLFPWATAGPLGFSLRLLTLGAVFSTIVGWPVAAVTFSSQEEVWQCYLGALAAGQVVVTVVALRLYLGWAYIGNRLFSATVEYEETGWYDGEVRRHLLNAHPCSQLIMSFLQMVEEQKELAVGIVWVKPPEVLARDRLLASYNVRPALNRMKATLLVLGFSLAATSVLLWYTPEPLQRPNEEAAAVLRAGPRQVYEDKAARSFEPQAFMDSDEPDRSGPPPGFGPWHYWRPSVSGNAS